MTRTEARHVVAFLAGVAVALVAVRVLAPFFEAAWIAHALTWIFFL